VGSTPARFRQSIFDKWLGENFFSITSGLLTIRELPRVATCIEAPSATTAVHSAFFAQVDYFRAGDNVAL